MTVCRKRVNYICTDTIKADTPTGNQRKKVINHYHGDRESDHFQSWSEDFSQKHVHVVILHKMDVIEQNCGPSYYIFPEVCSETGVDTNSFREWYW